MKLFSQLLDIIDLIFVFNVFNAKKICLEVTLERNLNCNKYIHFLITPWKRIQVYERLFFELLIAIVNDKKVNRRT